MHELGRRHARDARDRRFLLRDHPLSVVQSSRTYRYWYYRFNQDQTGDTCVANAGIHLLGHSPKSQPLGVAGAGGTNRTDSLTFKVAARVGMSFEQMLAYRSAQSQQLGVRGYVYDKAQLLDEWSDTPPEGGTSFRAEAKVFKTLGLISEYRWLVSLDEIVTAILELGPVTWGGPWLVGMMYRPDGSLVRDGDTITATGEEIGGHQVVFNGVNRSLGLIRVQTWGIHLRLPLASLQTLLGMGADTCYVVEP